MADDQLVLDPAADWRAGLPDDLKADKTLAQVKDVPALAKMVVEGQKLIGDSIRLPKAQADGTIAPADLAKWKTEHLPKLTKAGVLEGAPESPEKYDIQRPEAALHGGWDEKAEKDFLGIAHKLGLSKGQVQQVLDWYGGFVGGQMTAAQAEAKTVEAALRQEWGPNYDAKVGGANRAVQQFAGDEGVDFLVKTGLGRHPIMVKAWAAVYEALVEHGAMEGTGAGEVSAADAQAEIATIRSDRKHPFNNANHPDHLAAIDKVLALTAIAKGATR